MQIASQTSATETSTSLGLPHRLASALRRAPDTAPADGAETGSPPPTTHAAVARDRTTGSGPRPVERSGRTRSAHRDHAIVTEAGHSRGQDRIFADDRPDDGVSDNTPGTRVRRISRPSSLACWGFSHPCGYVALAMKYAPNIDMVVPFDVKD